MGLGSLANGQGSAGPAHEARRRGGDPPITYDPGKLGPLRGAPGLAGKTGGPTNQNLPPDPKKPKKPMKLWGKIKWFAKEFLKRLPWMMNP